MTETNFYEFGQSNPGGYFDTDMPRYMWIEASSEEEACSIAEEHGVYFNGVYEGIDCSCCGDRWGLPYMDPMTREELEERLALVTDPELSIRWDKWEDPEVEFKIVEKKD